MAGWNCIDFVFLGADLFIFCGERNYILEIIARVTLEQFHSNPLTSFCLKSYHINLLSNLYSYNSILRQFVLFCIFLYISIYPQNMFTNKTSISRNCVFCIACENHDYLLLFICLMSRLSFIFY